MSPSPTPVIGMWGTFDVDNYGDHLFPLVAEAELRRRLPAMSLRLASPYGHLHPTRFDGGLTVEPLPPWSRAAFDATVAELDCVLVGGGEIMHGNDRLLAPVYGTHPEELARLRPSGWFLEAAAEPDAATAFVLHAVGITAADDERVVVAADAAAITAVRDPFSAARLREHRLARTDLHVVPDTAFVLDRLLAGRDLDAAVDRLRRAGCFPERGRPLAVQGCDLLVPHAAEIAAQIGTSVDVVVVETGRGRGDHLFADALIAALGRPVWRMPADAGVIDIGAAVRASGAFVGSSLHGCITAAVFGRPFVTVDIAAEPKLAGLGEVTSRSECVVRRASDIPRALDHARRRAGALPADVASLQREIDRHFDRIAVVAVEAAASRRRRHPPMRGTSTAIDPHPAAVRSGASRVGIVVVDHDGGADALACLGRLHDELTWPPARIVLVDNGSAHPITADVRGWWPDVEVLELPDNVGFPAACNAAIRLLGDVDHVALVNNDAIPDVDFLEPLVGRLESDAELGAVVPKVLLRDRHVSIDIRSAAASPGPWDDRRLGVAVVAVEADGIDVTQRCLFARGGWGVEGDGAATLQWTDGDARLWVPVDGDEPDIKLLLDSGPAVNVATVSTAGGTTAVSIDGPTRVAVPAASPEDVVNGRGIAFAADGSAYDSGYLEADDGAGPHPPSAVAAWSGATVLLRRAYLDDVGPLRDDLFLYYEDVDHSLRGARRGWRFEYVPSSVVRHAHGATTARIPDLVRHLSARNRLLIIAEHSSPLLLARALTAHAATIVRAVRHDVLAARRSHRAPTWRHVRSELLVLGGFAQRLPRSLRGRFRR